MVGKQLANSWELNITALLPITHKTMVWWSVSIVTSNQCCVLGCKDQTGWMSYHWFCWASELLPRKIQTPLQNSFMVPLSLYLVISDLHTICCSNRPYLPPGTLGKVLTPVSTSRHGFPLVAMPPDLKTSAFVFVRQDAHRTPLQKPYVGHYKVLVPGNKTATLDMGGRQEVASIDRLKPAHLDIDYPVQVAIPSPPSLDVVIRLLTFSLKSTPQAVLDQLHLLKLLRHATPLSSIRNLDAGCSPSSMYKIQTLDSTTTFFHLNKWPHERLSQFGREGGELYSGRYFPPCWVCQN